MKEFLCKLTTISLAFLAPLHTVLIAIGCLVFIDLITAIIASRKTGKNINSAGLSRTVAKAIIYQVAIITGFIVEVTITGDLIPCAKIISSFIALTEILSILENLDKISGTPIFKRLISYLSSKNFKE